MALAPTYNWFHNWNHPADLFNHYHEEPQPLEIPHRFEEQSHHQKINPFKGYDFNQPTIKESGGRKLIYQNENQFSGEELSPFFNHGLFSSWNSPAKTRQSSKSSGQVSSVAKLLPTLLTLGMVSKLTADPSRGDQDPPGDPDRDIGGPTPLRTLYHWNLIDFAYDSDGERRAALDSKEFIPINTLPLGIETWKDRVFVTFPRWKAGVPCTLATVPRVPKSAVSDHSPKLKPYPSWDWHRQQGDCSGLTSVFRINADRCGRLWVLDSGQVEALGVPRQVCPPQLFLFNLTNDELIGRFPIPESHVRQDSLFTNIVTDIRKKCEDVHAYFTDVWRFSIIVFRLSDEKFWRFNSHLFYPDPMASDYNLHGINFQWSDGVFGISLTPLNSHGERTLFFHPMSSFREFMMPASVLRNETAANDTALIAKSVGLAGESRGYAGQSSAEAMDKNGVMFFNLVLRDAVGCWDSRKPYKRSNIGIVAQDHERLIFPNDLKIDNEPKQSVWVLSNRLPFFLYKELDPKDINFRIMREYVEEAVAGGVCDPRIQYLGLNDYEPECY